MILQSLVDYYETLARQGAIAKPGWGKYKISYAVNLNQQGEVIGILSLEKEVMRGKKEGICAYHPYAAGRREKSIGHPASVLMGECRILPGPAQGK